MPATIDSPGGNPRTAIRWSHAASLWALGVAALAAPAASQEAPAPDAAPGYEETLEDEIVVVGGKPRGAVVGDIPPENQLGPRDIRATGATSVAELLEAIAPQTASGRGRESGQPAVLLNGRRISGFREVRDLPPEAIERVDILPEEVALKYGYRADQRVVNIVLRPRFRSTVVRAEGEVPTEGGRSRTEADVTRLLLGENSRTTVNLHLERTTPLTEAERDIAVAGATPTPGAVDPQRLRTLAGGSELARIGGTLSRPLFGVSATIDGQVELNDGRSRLGPSAADPDEALERDTDGLSGRLGLAMTGDRGRWRWSLTGAYETARNVTLTDRDGAGARDRARSTRTNGEIDLVANGPLADLPAGRATATLRLGADTRDIDSRTRRAGVVAGTDLGRDEGSAALSVDLPIAKRGGALSALGNLSANANGEVETLSDFGTLTTLGGGFFWSPVARLNLIASFTHEQGAPGIQQLGDPLLATPNTRIFDFVRGETVLAEVVTGGNPDLTYDTRRVTKLGATFQPLADTDMELRADYVRTRTADPVARFPGPTAAVEAAFPERFVRDAAGTLLRVDLRPVNFDSAARDELRWGVNFTQPLKSKRPSQSVLDQFRRAREAGGAPMQSDRPRPPGGGRGFGGGSMRQGGRLTLSAYHTLLLRDEVRIRPGLPVLDYLDGEAGDTGGGRPRHRIEADAGWFNNGFGARLSANWQSGSDVRGGPSGDLDFAPLATVDLRLFANLGERFELAAKHPWLRGVQLRLEVDNLFDAKQRVRDAAGLVPISYQPDLIDPQGRTVGISIRKLFLPPRGTRRAGVPSR